MTKPIVELEERCLKFAKQVRVFIKNLPKTLINMDDARQVLRSSGSIGANYIEANEAVSKKDFQLRLRIAKKEAKETVYWFRLIDVGDNAKKQSEAQKLEKEAGELMSILGAILKKVQA